MPLDRAAMRMGTPEANLLARINGELERVSAEQHRLARRRAVLQEQATRLRLGARAAEAVVVLAQEPDGRA